MPAIVGFDQQSVVAGDREHHVAVRGGARLDAGDGHEAAVAARQTVDEFGAAANREAFGKCFRLAASYRCLRCVANESDSGPPVAD